MGGDEDEGHVTTGISLPARLLEDVDMARGPVPRSRWLAEAAERRLEEDREAVEALKAAVGGGDE